MVPPSASTVRSVAMRSARMASYAALAASASLAALTRCSASSRSRFISASAAFSLARAPINMASARPSSALSISASGSPGATTSPTIL